MEVEIRGMSSFFLSITMLCFWGVWAGKQWQWQCSHAKSLQSCPTLCHPMDCRPPGSSVHGILQARILEWVTFPAPEDLPNQGIKPLSLMSPWLALAGRFFTTSATWTVAEQQSRETSSSSSGGYSGDHAQSSRSCSHSNNCEWLFARDYAKDKNLHYISHFPYSKLDVQLALDLSYLFQQKSYLVSHPVSWDACAFPESIF